MVLGAPIVRGNQPVARVSAHHLRRPHPYPHFPFHRSMYTTFYSYITVRSLSLSRSTRDISVDKADSLNYQAGWALVSSANGPRAREREDREREGEGERETSKQGQWGKIHLFIGFSFALVGQTERPLFTRLVSLSWHRRGGGGGERGKNGAQSRRKRMNERRWAGARFNRNGKRSKSWQIFTFEVYKNPVFRSSLSRIFYNVVRIVIFAVCLIVSPSFFFFFFF